MRVIQSWLTVMVIGTSMLFAACSINVDDKDKKNEKVDIQTPLANLKVNTDQKSADNGIPVYPGARPRPETDNSSHRANVNIAGLGFGLKVIAAEYETDDPPEKVRDFYQDKLKKYGDVIVCKGHNDKGSDVKHSDNGKVSCADSSGDGWEVKVGTNDDQHLVSVEPQDKGTRFGTVLIQIHGKEGEL